jgi:hypothetical protein
MVNFEMEDHSRPFSRSQRNVGADSIRSSSAPAQMGWLPRSPLRRPAIQCECWRLAHDRAGEDAHEQKWQPASNAEGEREEHPIGGPGLRRCDREQNQQWCR